MKFIEVCQELSKVIPTTRIYMNESMKKYTSFKVGGNADILVKVKDIKELMHAVKTANRYNEMVTVIGNGSNILVKENGIILRKYTFILYGDSNGDGKINSADLLVLQRHILEKEQINDIYKKATNIRKNSKKPTSVDLLLIQRHILGLQIIEQ